MNRNFWLAAGLFVFASVFAVAILVVNVANPQTSAELNLVLAVGPALATLASAGFAAVGERERRTETVTLHSTYDQVYSQAPPLETMSEDDSRDIYLPQLREQIRRLEDPATTFVPLTTSTEPKRDVVRSELVPNLEWVDTRSRYDRIQATPENIPLLGIPERFPRSVLLGEPGSGKSTCLRQLGLETLTSFESDSGTRIPLLVSLSDWRDPAIGALTFLRRQLASLAGASSYYVVNFDRLLASGRFLLLLDGLNEMPGRSDSGGDAGQDGGDAVPGLPRPTLPRTDPRERSLRELATSTAQRSSFVITCRRHEYLDSLEWQVVQVLPMSPEQTDRFLEAHVSSDRVAEVRHAIDTNPLLAELATNPFFLRVIIEVQRPDRRLESRGEVMAYLLKTLLQREAEHADSTASETQIIRHIGPVAFRMLQKGLVGGQAAIPARGAAQGYLMPVLLDTGLVVRRGAAFYFLHQIIQEFFAAAALQRRFVRRRPASLLADKRWSEVVALWTDLAPDAMVQKVMRCLKARNQPWRRPPSPTQSATYLCYSALTSTMIVVFAGVLLYGTLFGVPHTLPLPLGAVSAASLALFLAALLVVRLAWRPMLYHRGVIVNAAYVLGLARNPKAIPALVPAFARLFHQERAELSAGLATFGADTLPHLLTGLGSRRWRIRAGCVQALGALLAQPSARDSATNVLLALTQADDPQLLRPLSEALAQSHDPRTTRAIASLVARTSEHGQFAAALRLQPLMNAHPTTMPDWNFGDVADRLRDYVKDDKPPALRVWTMRIIGALRLPESEQLLTGVAQDSSEAQTMRDAAVAALGLAQTAEAVSNLAELGDLYPELGDAVAKALTAVRDESAFAGLVTASASPEPLVRRGAAVALGGSGMAQALQPLTRLSDDWASPVRSAAARGLGLLGSSDAVPHLSHLARDPDSAVRHAAFDALRLRYPDLAASVLVELAKDRAYSDRIRAIRLLAGHDSPLIEPTLVALGGDADRGVREVAGDVLANIRSRRETSRRGRRAILHPLRSVRAYLSRQIQLAGLRDMWEEENLMGTPSNEIFNRIQSRIYSDAELKRRYRVAIAIFVGAFVCIVGVGGVFAVGVMLALLALAELLLEAWPVTVAMLATGGVALLISRTAPTTRRFRVVKWPQGLVMAVLCVAVVGGVVYTWWIWLLLFAGPLVFWVLRDFRRKIQRRHVVVAALDGSAPAVSPPVILAEHT